MKLKVFVATYRPLLKLPQQFLRLHGDLQKAGQDDVAMGSGVLVSISYSATVFQMEVNLKT